MKKSPPHSVQSLLHPMIRMMDQAGSRLLQAEAFQCLNHPSVVGSDSMEESVMARKFRQAFLVVHQMQAGVVGQQQTGMTLCVHRSCVGQQFLGILTLSN